MCSVNMAKVRVQFDLVQTNGAGQRQTNTAQSAPESWFGRRPEMYACVCVCVRVCDYYPLTAIGLLWQTQTINWLNSQRNMPRDDSGVNYA